MKIKRIICMLVLVVSAVVTIFFSAEKLKEESERFSAKEYKGILTCWHIDSFEGGKGSRKSFLLKIARSFEKTNVGIYIMVIDHTEKSANEAIARGEYPDMISFGLGVEIKAISKLDYDKSFKGGRLGKISYAYPWCEGRYYLVTKEQSLPSEIKIENLVVSKSDYTLPLTALLEENFIVNNFTIKPPLDAYVDFVTNKDAWLLGTQRDIIRLENRGLSVSAIALDGYNDLYQYVSVTANDQTRAYYSNQFIKFLLSENSQKKLSEIGMFSREFKVEHGNQWLSLEKPDKEVKTISAFTLRQDLTKMHSYSMSALKGDKESAIKIKNMLI